MSADLIESSHSRNARDNDVLGSIAERLAGIESHINRKPDDEGYRPIRGALARLETRIETLSNKPSDTTPDRNLRELDRKLSEIAARLSDGRDNAQSSAPQLDQLARRHATQIARLEARIANLAANIGVSQAISSKPEPRALEVDDISDSLVAPRPAGKRQLADAILEISQRQRDLDEGFSTAPVRMARRIPAPDHAAVSAIEARLLAVAEKLERSATRAVQAPVEHAATGPSLQDGIAKLSEGIEAMRLDIAARNAAQTSGQNDSAPINQIRAELATMTRALGELAPRTSIASLERAVQDISASIALSRSEGVRESVLAPIESMTRDLHSAIKDADPRASIDGIEREIRTIAGKLEAVAGRPHVDPQVLTSIVEQTRDVRDLLVRAAAAPLNNERIERQLEALANHASEIGAEGRSGAMNDLVGDIRAMVANPYGGPAIKALEQKFESLNERIGSVMSSAAMTNPGAEQIAAIGQRLDTMHDAFIRSVSGERAAPKADTSQIESMVRDLATRIDGALDPRAGSGALDALQGQIEKLAKRLDRSDESMASVSALERKISDLFRHLDNSRIEAVEAVENAARDVMQDAMSANVGKLTPDAELIRDIADLRAMHDATDDRTHATLTAVHETLERVVDRLATLEGDIADVRHAPAKSGAQRGAAPELQRATRAVQAANAAHDAPVLRTDVPETLNDPASDILIEPGSGFMRRSTDVQPDAKPAATKLDDAKPAAKNTLKVPVATDRRAIAVEEPQERNAQASFIAAARRAAQAAADSAPSGEVAQKRAKGGKSVSLGMGPMRNFMQSRKRPILLSLAAIMMLVGALQVARIVADGPMASAPVETPAPKINNAPVSSGPASSLEPRIVQPAPAQTGAMQPPNADDNNASVAAPSAKPANALPQAMPTGVAMPTAVPARKVDLSPTGTDRSPVGTIDPSPANDINQIKAAATQGDAAAQYDLAVRYADGRAVPRDSKISAQWFEKAATKGSAPAQYRLGAIYERGMGVTRDPVLARLWYQRAADRGNARAMHNLAVLYAEGTDGKPNYSDAVIWFRKAAEFGVRDSQYNLAILYARGLGTGQNLVESYVWFSAAAAQGDEDSGRKREDVAAKLEARELSRAKTLAEAFRAKPQDAAANDAPTLSSASGLPNAAPDAMPPKGDGRSMPRPKMSNL